MCLSGWGFSGGQLCAFLLGVGGKQVCEFVVWVRWHAFMYLSIGGWLVWHLYALTLEVML
jgi:hypothetical protein